LNCTPSVKAQKLFLKLSDSANNSFEIAYLKVYCKNSTTLIGYYILRDSFFAIPANYSCTDVKFEISVPGYQDYEGKIKLTGNLKDTLLCILSNLKIKDLQPVVITGQSRPVQIRNDTTTYNIKSFSDGTEQKLSDILEKLPGIEVNKKSGEIKFKGKPIETILLEGDNLFGVNYTLGSKNINANLVTEVQAIENYSENYVLKGLENDDKVALNIKFGKAKLKMSGNSEIGMGVQDSSKSLVSDINSNILGLGKMHKFFSTLSFNNIGINKSPTDYFGNNSSIEQLKERKYAAQKYIVDPSFTTGESKNYSNINSQLFGSHNSMMKLSSKLTLKGSVYYVKDRISNQQNFTNEYFLTNDTIKTSDITKSQKNPQSLKGDLHLRYAISSGSLLEIAYSETNDETKSNRFSNSNFIPVYETNLLTEEKYNKLLATYTKRLNKTQALQFEFRKTKSITNQSYNVSPSLFKRNLFAYDEQNSRYVRNYTQLTTTLFGVKGKNKYNIYIKALQDQTYFSSAVINRFGNASISSKINDLAYQKPAITQGANFTFELGNLKLTPSYNFTFLHQQWFNSDNGNKLSKNSILLEPTIKLKYVLTKISALSFTYYYSYKNSNDQFLYPEIIIQNFRNVTNNRLDLSLISANTITLNYSRSDLYNQIDNGIGATFQKNNRDFLPTYNITDSLLYTTFGIESVNNKALDIYTYINKYIPQIKLTVKLSLNNTVNFYNNYLSPGVLRSNIYNSTSVLMFFKTVFKGKINYEAESSLMVNKSKSSFTKAITNLSTISNAKIVFIPNKIMKMYLTGDYFLPSISVGKGNLFLSYYLSYKPQNSKIELKLTANNITNNQTFIQYQISDYSNSIFKINTLPRSFLIYCSFQF